MSNQKEKNSETKIQKYYTSQKADINETERTLIHYVTTKAVDRDNEVVIPEGITLFNYQKNPQVLWNHISFSDKVTTIGKSLWQKADSSGLLCKTEFASTSLASEVFELYKGGFLTSWSIGFIVKDFIDENNIRTFTSTELLEYSAVTIPANPEAVSLSFIKSLKSDELKHVYVNDYLLHNMETEIKNLNNTIQVLQQSPNPDEIKSLIHQEILKQINPKLEHLANELSTLKLDKIKSDVYKTFYEKASQQLF